MEKPDADRVGQDPQISVRIPGRLPALYPQAARVLRRIVVRLARAGRGTDDAPRPGERAS
jgi:hypothetical protein